MRRSRRRAGPIRRFMRGGIVRAAIFKIGALNLAAEFENWPLRPDRARPLKALKAPKAQRI